MNTSHAPTRFPQHGMALISALLLLVVITILGVAMFRSFGIQERIAGNTREKQRAVHAAESAENYAEWWLTSANGVNASTGVDCTGTGLVSADSGGGQVCTNILKDVATILPATPLNIGGTETAVTYTPPGLTVGTDAANIYVKLPEYYISYLSGNFNQTTGESIGNYQIDSLGYGGNTNSMAVVETVYVVSKIYTNSSTNTKFVNLGGP